MSRFSDRNLRQNKRLSRRSVGDASLPSPDTRIPSRAPAGHPRAGASREVQTKRARDAKTHRHQIDPDHRRRPDRHRPGLRVRLFRHAGLQGAEGRGLSRHPGQLQSGHDHDRSGTGGRHLYRADHAGSRGQDHRQGAAGRAAADHGRPDGAEHRAVAAPHGRARALQCRDDRRQRGRHRQGRGPRAVPRGDEEDRAGDAALDARQCHRGQGRRPQAPRGRARRAEGRAFRADLDAALDALETQWNLGEGDRKQRYIGHAMAIAAQALDHVGLPAIIRPSFTLGGTGGGIAYNRAEFFDIVAVRPRRLADHRSADRGERARLEGIRDGGGPRQGGQLHHRLLDREHRSDGRSYRRLHHRRAGADA